MASLLDDASPQFTCVFWQNGKGLRTAPATEGIGIPYNTEWVLSKPSLKYPNCYP